MSNTTNDPEQKYGERKPMTEDEAMLAWAGSPKKRMLSAFDMMHQGMHAMDVSDHYEALITDGTLIRRDELLAWLSEHRRICGRMLAQTGARGEGIGIGMSMVIDHLNKKPA